MDDRERLTKFDLLERSDGITRLLADIATSYDCGVDYIQHMAMRALDQHLQLQADVLRNIMYLTDSDMELPQLSKTKRIIIHECTGNPGEVRVFYDDGTWSSCFDVPAPNGGLLLNSVMQQCLEQPECPLIPGKNGELRKAAE